MKYTLNFFRVVAQIATVFTVTFILPAVIHALVTLNLSNYLKDLCDYGYQGGMAILSSIITIVYIIMYSMEIEERAERKRAGLNQSLKF